MRITFVLPPLNMSGGIRVLAIYAERLIKRGHRVEVVVLPKPRRKFRSKVKALILGNGWPREIMISPSHFDGLDIPLRFLSSSTPSAEEFPEADVVLATFWRTASVVANLPSDKGAKAILLQGYETSPGFESTEIDAVWRLGLRKIVISEWMVKLARDRFGDDKVFHVPNSVDLDLFYAMPRGKRDVPTVGFLYSSLHLKGVDVTYAAIDNIRRKYPTLRVISFGAEPVEASVPLPLGTEFYLCPEQELIRSVYESCDVWVCGSRREGFHLPPLEAMACRCPVVSTRVGGPMDTIVDGVNGYLVDVEDAESLAKCAIKVLSLPEDDWRSMSESALATATRYTWDDATRLLEQSLTRLHAEF